MISSEAIHLSMASACYNIVVLTTTLLPLYFLVCAIYHLRFSPLSSIPGPWYAAISDFWLITHVVRLQQCKTVQTLFDTYGSVVRIGPNKIAFRDITSTKSIYATHKFNKSSYYKSLLTNNNDHAMTTLSHAEHVSRKKGYAPHYVPANLHLFQPEMRDFSLELVDIFDHAGGNISFECLNVFRHLMVDVISVTVYGYRLGALKKWSLGIEEPLSTAVYDFPKRGIIRSAVPTWAWNLICRFPNYRWRKMCDSDKIMAEFISGRVYEMRNQMNSGVLEEPEKISMLQRLLHYRNGSSNELMSDQDVISEGMGHTIAGVDTTSTTLAYLFWELSRRSDIKQKLQAELDETMPDRRSLPDIDVLYKLPYLAAFIKEGLRIYGGAPSLLERVVPSTTSKSDSFDDGYDLMGYSLPASTIVATQAWSLHRDPSIFPSPDTFLPDRWLETSENRDQLAQMAQHMMPFGIGSRVCGGQNLAQMMLRIAVASVVRNFDIVAPPETNDKSMDIRDAFVIFPASTECNLKFTPRKHR